MTIKIWTLPPTQDEIDANKARIDIVSQAKQASLESTYIKIKDGYLDIWGLKIPTPLKELPEDGFVLTPTIIKNLRDLLEDVIIKSV